jgi:hypothetical protein
MMMRWERCIVPIRRGVKSLRESGREPIMDAEISVRFLLVLEMWCEMSVIAPKTEDSGRLLYNIQQTVLIEAVGLVEAPERTIFQF